MIHFWKSPHESNQKFIELFKLYDPTFKYHTINDFSFDAKLKAGTHVYMISPYSNEICPSSTPFDYPIEQEKEYIDAAISMGMQVYIDSSWEIFQPHLYDNSELGKHHDYLIANNIKVICPEHFYDKQPIEARRCGSEEYNRWYQIQKPFELFPFHTRFVNECINHFYHLNTHPVTKDKKKYFFSMFTGDLNKIRNAYLIGLYFYRDMNGADLLDQSVYSGFCEKFHLNIEQYEKAIEHMSNVEFGKYQDEVDFFFNNQKSILVNRPFERYENKYDWHGDIPNNFQERRMPQVVNESHLYLAVETSGGNGDIFYTEKTWKPIMHGMPFLINGPALSNTLLKEWGYEIFDEIIDYSFEEVKRDFFHLDFIRYHHDYLNEVERLISEGPEIFYQPSVIEKVEHNKALFYEKTTLTALIEAMEEYFAV